MTRDAGRLPGLDGLRAVAALLVAFSHLTSIGALSTLPALRTVLQQGAFGVTVFFVLSGFLITWLLLREEAAHGAIDLKRFFFRRSLRILPPALVYLAVMGLLTAVGVLAVGSRDLWYSVFFVRNLYGVGGSPEVAHYWSLAVEEQFYLAWPFAFLLVTRWNRLILTAVTLLAVTGWRVWGGVHFGATATGAHALLVGCLLAQLRQLPATSPLLSQGMLHSPTLLVANLGVIVLLVFVPAASSRVWGWVHVLPVLATGLVVNYVIAGHRDPFSRLMNLPPVEWVGRLSYSLYLWQQIFCWSSLATPYAESGWPILFSASLLCACASYYGVERPALDFRARLERRRAEATPLSTGATARETGSLQARA
jgi:peptidoglycan/LPS O-acetylase OafA/YrhL